VKHDLSIALDDAKAPDGTRTGWMALGNASWRITDWRPGGDKNHVLLRIECQDDGWVEAFVAGEMQQAQQRAKG
jgi:hypothetical protein